MDLNTMSDLAVLMAKHQEWTEKGAERCQLLGNVEKTIVY
jgi:hypothetical protein